MSTEKNITTNLADSITKNINYPLVNTASEDKKTFAIFSKDEFTDNELQNFNERPRKKLTSFKYKQRFYYYKEFKNNPESKATIIMINPSVANHIEEDSTIKNVIAVIEKHNFESFEIINLFSYRHPELDILKNLISHNAYQNDWININDEIAKFVIKNTKTVIPAWGVESSYKASQIEKFTKYIQKHKPEVLFLAGNDYPRHFGSKSYGLLVNAELTPSTSFLK